MTAKGTKFYSDKQEKMVASYLGWRQVTGSGARPNHPGDVISDSWLGECKTHATKKKTVVFILDFWDKIADEAASRFKRPALFVDDGTQKAENTLVMIKCSSSLTSLVDRLYVYEEKTGSISLPLSRFKDTPFHVFQLKRHMKFTYCIMPLATFKSYIEQVG